MSEVLLSWRNNTSNWVKMNVCFQISMFYFPLNPPTIAALQVQIAVEVKISQLTVLTVLTVDPNVHTGTFLTAFYCHLDHPEQYQTMLLPDKNSRLILTCKCTYYT